MTKEFIKRLLTLGRELADSARSRVQNGDVGNDDADLVSKSMHIAGYIEALAEDQPAA